MQEKNRLNKSLNGYIYNCIKFTWTLRLEWIRTVCNIQIHSLWHTVLDTFAEMEHQNRACWCPKSEPKIKSVSIEIHHFEEDCCTVAQRKIMNASNISVSSSLQELLDISQTSPEYYELIMKRAMGFFQKVRSTKIASNYSVSSLPGHRIGKVTLIYIICIYIS